MTYAPRRPAQTAELPARGLTFWLHRWSGADPHLTVLLHGWGDTGATWQFLVDHLSAERNMVALDLRGFGRTRCTQDGFWFPDYLADLDAVLDRLSPQAPIDLIGHSMGGNVAMLYSGVRPQRVRKLVSLEGFGMPRSRPEQAPTRYAQWLDELKEGSSFATYDSYEQFMRVLARRNPRTPAERIEFIARSWAREREDGRIELWADAGHRRVNPVLYQRDQAEACWQAIVAPVLFVRGDQSEFARRMESEIADARLRELLRDVTPVTLQGAGHMLHHECPQELGVLIDEFLSGARAESG